MANILTDRAPETDENGVISRNVSANGPVSESAGVADSVDVLSKGGSTVADTGHAENVTGGGKAVPDAGFFQNQTDAGDSLDDGTAGGLGGGTADVIGNAGTI